MSTFSSLKFELILTGDQSGQWGNTTNANIGTAINEAIAGSVDITFASADLTLTLTDTNAAQSARNLRLNLTGTAGGAARTLTLGSGCQINKPYIVNNTLANAVTVKNTTGTGIAVPAGATMWLFNNGTNVVDVVSYLSSLTLGTALVATSGGTGQSSYAVGDLLYANTTTTLAKLADIATGNALISGGVTTAPSWGKIGLTTHITGTLAATNGGTGASTTTTGDLLYGSASDTWTKLAGNTTTTRKYLVSVGSGSAATAPEWDQIDIGGTDITGTLAATNGGTGTATVTTGDILYGGTTSNTWAKLAAGTAGQLLQTNGAAAPSWVNAPTFTGVSSFTGGTTGLLPSTASTGAISLSGTLAIGSGGTGATTQQTAINALAGAVTIRKFLRGDGTNVSMADIEVADVPTLNQSTTGTAGGLGAGIVLPVASGGTSHSSYSTGDILYASAPGALTKLAAGTTGYALLTNGPSAGPSWGQIALGSAVSGTLPVANGGTGTATPSLVAGTNVTITGTWPNQTINSSGGGGSVPGGAANQIVYQSASSTSTFIAAPTTASTYLSWTGSAFAWANVTPGSTFAGDISVNGLTVGRGTASVATNTALGYQANNAVTTAPGLTSVGYQANKSVTTSPFHTAVGYQANAAMVDSYGVGPNPWETNTAVGYQALTANYGFPGISSNTAVGGGAAAGLTGGYLNVSVGSGAGPVSSAATNVCIGAYAGRYYSNQNSILIGYETYSQVTGTTATGSGITAIGHQAMYGATAGSSGKVTDNCVALGYRALYALDPGLGANSYRNTALGSNAGSSLETGVNNTLLGYSAQASTTTASNEFVLGNSSVSVLRCQQSSISGLSDARDKYDIEDLPVGLDFINSLKARRFKWDKRDAYFDEIENEDGSTTQVAVPKDGSRKSEEWNEGFIAQEMDEAATAAGADWMKIVYKSNPEKLEMAPGKLIPVLVKAIQELTARLEALEARN